MTVHKKTFEATAAIFREAVAKPAGAEASRALSDIAKRFADQFAASNPRFKRGRWYRAAGFEALAVAEYEAEAKAEAEAVAKRGRIAGAVAREAARSTIGAPRPL